MLDRAWIMAHIPHQGSMCLLDAVERWDADEIVCRALSHPAADNPLRAAGRLGIANIIEYAAQAMAVHGALLAGDAAPPKAGYLTSVRDVRWQRASLDDLSEPLILHAQRLSGSEINALYRFEARAGDELLASGRIGVVLDAAALGG
jgi:predicted hotdog family 3-hydroxylacyl-ACP dehydratase